MFSLEVFSEREVTADGREESEEHETSVFKLVDVIQIYPKKEEKHEPQESSRQKPAETTKASDV